MRVKPVKKSLHNKICAYCGRRFEAEQSNAKYCSDSCRSFAWREKKKKKGRPKGSKDKKPRKKPSKRVRSDKEMSYPGDLMVYSELIKRVHKSVVNKLNSYIDRGGKRFSEDTLKGILHTDILPDKDFSTGKYVIGKVDDKYLVTAVLD